MSNLSTQERKNVMQNKAHGTSEWSFLKRKTTILDVQFILSRKKKCDTKRHQHYLRMKLLQNKRFWKEHPWNCNKSQKQQYDLQESSINQP